MNQITLPRATLGNALVMVRAISTDKGVQLLLQAKKCALPILQLQNTRQVEQTCGPLQVIKLTLWSGVDNPFPLHHESVLYSKALKNMAVMHCISIFYLGTLPFIHSHLWLTSPSLLFLFCLGPHVSHLKARVAHKTQPISYIQQFFFISQLLHRSHEPSP